MSSLRVVVAPDSFKGTASAADVAAAIADGWRSVRPADLVQEVPLADGGEGTVEAFRRALPDAVVHRTTVPGPDDRPVEAEWLALPDGTAVVELASASGLPLLAEPRPLDAHARGLGRVLAAALGAGATRLLVGLGGSASTDGGASVLRELGARLLDSLGEEVPDGGRGLSSAVRLDLTGLLPLPARGVVLLTDVAAPLLGPRGAAAVYGPQKGADPDDVLALESGLEHWAALVAADGSTPGAGAAGGVAFGLLAWGAQIVGGAPAVGEALGLDPAIAEADLVVTGEGRFDRQTADGKAVSHVVGLARAAGVPVALVAGRVDPSGDAAPFVAVRATGELAGDVAESLRRPTPWLRRAGVELAEVVPERLPAARGLTTEGS
ncbi:glycerate kinase [Frigoribacterium salinisoli]